MSNRDRKYTPGGTDQVNGNYEDDYTIGSRAARLYMAERGRWPAARGRVFGSRLHELKKGDEETPAQAQRMITEAFEPLLSSGEMGALEVSSEYIVGRDDALGNVVTWVDNTSSDGSSHERESGRQG